METAPPRRHRTPWTESDLQEASALMREGRSNKEIAELIGRTESTTNVMFYRLGLNRGASNCLHCAAPLPQPDVGRKRRYCDENCRTAEERTQRLVTRETTIDPDRQCPYCNGAIPLERQRRGSSVVVYCSRTCSQDAWYARKCAAAGRTPVKKGPRQRTSMSEPDPTST